MLTIYGIPNCTSVQKTRAYLDAHHIAYVFHDFKKQSIDAQTLRHWLNTVPLNVLINKKGTTWRGLSPETQAMAASESSAIELMLAHTSVIKRPVMVSEAGIAVGYDENFLNTLRQHTQS